MFTRFDDLQFRFVSSVNNLALRGYRQTIQLVLIACPIIIAILNFENLPHHSLIVRIQAVDAAFYPVNNIKWRNISKIADTMNENLARCSGYC